MKERMVEGLVSLWHRLPKYCCAWIALAIVCFVDIVSQWNLFRTSIGGWGYIFRETFVYASFLCGFILLLGRIGRVLCSVLIVYEFLVVALNSISKTLFGQELENDALMIAVGCSKGETFGFLRDLCCSSPCVLAILSAIAGVAIVITILWRSVIPCGKTSRCVGALLLLPMLFVYGLDVSAYFSGTASARLTVGGYKCFALWHKMDEVSRSPMLTQGAVVDKPVCGVFVIGESATRNNWSLYGYPRDTNPRLNAIKDELFVFRDVLAAWSHTHQAVRFLLSDCTLDDEDSNVYLPQVCTNAGIRTSLISLQKHMGGVDTSGRYLFSACQHKKYLGDYNSSERGYDVECLPTLQSEISHCPTNESLVVFLHAYGSHQPWGEAYPQDRAYYSKNVKGDLMAEYDDAIRETDRFLGEIINILKTQNRDCFMIYISDHGETPRAGNGRWRQIKDRDLWEVPMIVWYSEGFASNHQKLMMAVHSATAKPLQEDQLFWGLVEMLGVRIPMGVSSNENFLSDAFQPRKTRMICNGKTPYSITANEK